GPAPSTPNRQWNIRVQNLTQDPPIFLVSMLRLVVILVLSTCVASATPDQPASVLSVTPSTATGNSGTFTFVYSDTNGAADLAAVEVIFNSVGGAGQCYLEVSPV